MKSTLKGSKPDTAALLNKGDKYEEARDFRTAFKVYLAGARLGDSSCQINLGNYYSWGWGTKQDLKKAEHWYHKAYKNGNAIGALNLGVGKREQGNIRSAIAWFKKAVAMNDGSAHIALARIYMSRRSGHKAAANLLLQAIWLNRDNISELARNEAETLLAVIPGKKRLGIASV